MSCRSWRARLRFWPWRILASPFGLRRSVEAGAGRRDRERLRWLSESSWLRLAPTPALPRKRGRELKAATARPRHLRVPPAPRTPSAPAPAPASRFCPPAPDPPPLTPRSLPSCSCPPPPPRLPPTSPSAPPPTPPPHPHPPSPA